MPSSGPRCKFLLLTLTLISAGLCAAQDVRWGRPPVPTQGACFYKETDFQGEYFCVRAGQSQTFLPSGFNDRIYSVRIFGGAPVTIFVDGNFRGAQATTRSSIRDLRNWRTSEGGTWGGRLSSFRIGSGFSGGPDWDDGRQSGACFYKETNFRGESFCMREGQSYAELPRGFNDNIQSLRIIGNARVTVFVDGGFRDTRAETDRDYPDLYQWRAEGGTWSRRISSIRVTSGGRPGGNWPPDTGGNWPPPDNGGPGGNWPGGGWSNRVIPSCQEAIRNQLIPQFGGVLNFDRRPNVDKTANLIMVRGRADYRDGSGRQGQIEYNCSVRPNGNVANARYNVLGSFQPRRQPR